MGATIMDGVEIPDDGLSLQEYSHSILKALEVENLLKAFPLKLLRDSKEEEKGYHV